MIKPKQIHSTPATKHFYCDGRYCFEVLPRRRNLKAVEDYWCSKMHGYFEPKTMTAKKCPLQTQQEIKPDLKPTNNSWLFS